MIKVWRRENVGNSYQTITQVEVGDNGGVNVACWSIGPRGGARPGYPGFTKREWKAIVEAVERGRCHLHPDAEPYETHPADPENGPSPDDCFNEYVCPDCENKEANA
jgi:hypothetical protein